MNEATWKFETVFTLKQPLSHIGESESTSTFLNTIRVMNNGKPEEVFAYTGNAIRGAWRDAGAKYLLDKLSSRVPKKAFNLLFSGGSIGGDQSNDVVQAKTIRDVLPFLSMFGGGVGNQILSGKLSQTFALPVCLETSGIIPTNNPYIDYRAQAVSWRQQTGEIQFSRKDDGKDMLGQKYISTPSEQMSLLEQSEGKGKKTKGKSDDGPATQMRYQVEYLIPGTQLWHQMHVTSSELELGALVSSIHRWGECPVLGGMSAKGFGAVDVQMDMVDKDGKREPFINILGSEILLSPPADEAKTKYDMHLKSLYDSMLEGNRDTIINLMEGEVVK